MTDVAEQSPEHAPDQQTSTSPPAAEQIEGHRPHPTDAQYILIALILAIVTGIEVGVYYIKGLGDAGNPLLLILAAIKFIIVVSFFMHLRFDNRLLRRVFVTGIVLALAVYIIVFFSLGVFTSSHGVHG